MSEQHDTERMPRMAELEPDHALIETTQLMMDVVTRLVNSDVYDPIRDEASDILTVLHSTEEFSSYWDAWQETMSRAIRIHARNVGFTEPVDSFIQLEMLLGSTGSQANVDIFHTDMTNADFLPNSADTTAIRESHRITEQVFTIRGDYRAAGFMLFAEDRSNIDVRRSLFVLADRTPPEMVDFSDPSSLDGYKMYPGNISNGEYLFGSRGLSPAVIAGDGWDNWRQARPWKFVDISNSFHRAPADTSDRELLLRLDVYAAPARDPDQPISVRIPIFKFYPPSV